ncbi:hypothetical protein DD238_002044 [Peronospora effusa]|uniref:Nucleotide-diphospho-sugar transferase domain-containing protein n=1 Tax=Peronospora effusa TaxID=542832 RepID=A0A3M6VU66_9STRA|nr:hypothetical protein DD238_007784 [Peronospora effusa]RMX69611.1 hypothetical protein DD238_002044 [Peronospora effusa]
MVRSPSSKRPRWIVLPLAAIVIFVLFDFFFTWKRLTSLAGPGPHHILFPSAATLLPIPPPCRPSPILLAQPNDSTDRTVPKMTVPQVIPMKVEHNVSRTASECEQIQVDDRATSRLEPLESEQTDHYELDKQLVYTLSQIIQRTTTKRGIVMPLFERIARLGFSLILELRAMGVSLPIEVPYCTDLNPNTLKLFQKKKELGKIRAYDICDLAANAKSVTNTLRPVFCDNIHVCYKKFRSFMIKPLAIIYSQFDQILMLDADTTFFLNPTVLFDSEKFKTTGILLMHDRICRDNQLMAQLSPRQPNLSVEQEYFSMFNVAPFRPVPTLQRPKATVPNKTPVKLNFEPSDFLLSSHSFNRRSGHQVDSSLMLWDKKLQPRATYSFSDYAIGSIGSKLKDGGPKKSSMCDGDMAHLFPIREEGVPDDDVPLFYLNSDYILDYKPDVNPLFYTKARPWAHYHVRLTNRDYKCLYGISLGSLNESHINHLAERQKFSEQNL